MAGTLPKSSGEDGATNAAHAKIAPRFSERLRAWLPGLFLAALTAIIYLPVLRHDFLAYDDTDYVTENRMVKEGLTPAGAGWAFTTLHASNWHPLTWISHMLDAQIFDGHPGGPHAVNVLIHITNTVLVFIILRRFTGAVWRSALVASLFALHPLHVESVAWIAERKDVLSGLFFLLTLWAYGKYLSAAVRSAGSRIWYGCALLLFILGLMSKPMLVTLPFVLLLLDYWPLQRLAVGNWRRAVWPLVWEKIPFLALSVAAGIVTLVAQQQGGAVRSLASVSLGARVDNALVSYARYLGKTFWPEKLSVFYPHPGQWPREDVVMAAALVAGLSLAALWLTRRHPFAPTGWFWFAGMLLPVIGLVQAGGQAMADRYTYLPLIGAFIVIVWGAGEAVKHWRWPNAVTGIAASLVLIACAARTHDQLRHWRDSESLFRHALAVTDKNELAHNNFGNLLLSRGQVDEALIQFQLALEIRPGYGDAHLNLGQVLMQQGRRSEAIVHFQNAIQIMPGDAPAHNNLANALLEMGRVDEAIAEYRKALALKPDFALAHNNLGWVLFQRGQIEEALIHLRTAVKIQSDYANAHNNLGDVLMRRGQIDEAIAHFRKAVELQPAFVGAQSNLHEAQLRKANPNLP